MSAIKHPITLAFLTAAVVFAVSYYYYNHYSASNDESSSEKKKSKNDKSKNDKKSKSKTKRTGVNETTIVLSAIAGLIAWYVANSYFTEKSTKNSDNDVENVNVPKIDLKDASKGTLKGGGTNLNLSKIDMNGLKVNATTKIPQIESDDVTRSYNLLGSGLDIPRSELKIPNVLIDYH